MQRVLCFIVVSFLLCLQCAFAIEPKDQLAIDKVVQRWTHAWNRDAGVGLGKLYSDDADFVNIFGMHFHGGSEIEERHVAILRTFLQGSLFSVVDMQFREVSPGLVIALVHWKLDGFYRPNQDRSSSGEIRYGRFTHVFIKREGKWEITATQNTLLPDQ